MPSKAAPGTLWPVGQTALAPDGIAQSRPERPDAALDAAFR
jgi:hypothetical protein